jgi:hypothetical protein
MSEHPFPENVEIRARVLDALLLFRHADALSSIRPDLTGERIAFELCRLWFDDVYTPSRRYMEGLKGDWDADAEEAFRDAFSPEESTWLERFHRFLELRIDRLSAAQKADAVFPNNDTWRGVMRDAGNLLDLMDDERARRVECIERACRELVPWPEAGHDSR